MRNLLIPPACPLGHGKLRGYTFGSRLLVEAVLIAFLFVTYVAASAVGSGLPMYILVATLLVLVLTGIVILDFFVLKYRCSACGLTFTRQELASRRPP